MKTFFSFFARTFLPRVLVVIAFAGNTFAQEVTLRLHHFLPSTSTIPADGIAPWAKRIEAASNGRIKIEIYPGMQLGGAPPQLFDQARDGVADIIWTVLGYTPGRFPKSEVFETPFMVTNGENTSRAFQQYVETYAMDEFKDVHLIAVHTHGPGLFHMKEPLTSLEDLAGRKVRGGSRIISEMLASLGAEPIGMPLPSVPQSLSTGVISGPTIPWEVTTAFAVSELVSNHTGFAGDNGLYTQTFALVMNNKTYDDLPADLKEIINAESGIEVAAQFGAAMDAGDIVGRKVAEDLGNSILTLDETETARWKEAAQPTIDNWIAQTPEGQMLFDAAKALVEEYSKTDDY
ncbi:MAG: TRAP transporter substrate-binding protein [Devosiaceae bacterium]|nr:TRAP transporter substrate-binding protein [Devosiaceae bacterium]